MHTGVIHNSREHHRRSIRLKGYDYTQSGMYFVTLFAWQRNYYDRIIRDEQAYQHIAQYIQKNPLHWQEDQLHASAHPYPITQE